MSKSAISIYVFGIYLGVMGLGFLFFPDTVLGLFGISSGTGLWIRISAMLILILSYYYICLARQEDKSFFRLTVHARATVILFFVTFTLLGMAPPVLISFGVVDLIAAAWTAIALRSE